MTVCDLTDKNCVPCEGGVAPMDAGEARKLMSELHNDWNLDTQMGKICREITTKNFAKAMQAANVVGYVGEQEGHHPDIAFGWGYCRVTFTTHAINGLSENDFICAAKIDRLLG